MIIKNNHSLNFLFYYLDSKVYFLSKSNYPISGPILTILSILLLHSLINLLICPNFLKVTSIESPSRTVNKSLFLLNLFWTVDACLFSFSLFGFILHCKRKSGGFFTIFKNLSILSMLASNVFLFANKDPKYFLSF